MLAQIIQKKMVAEQTLHISLALSESIKFKAGQYFYITLIDPPYSDAKGSRRDFSFANAPHENGIEFSTRITNSAFKQSITEFSLGTSVEISTITGDFLLPEETKKPIVLIACGVGITPFRSMVRHVLHQKQRYEITLLHFNQSKKTTPYFDEFNDLLKNNLNIRYIPIMTRDQAWNGHTGHFSEHLISAYIETTKQQKAHYLIAGKPQAAEAIYQSLKNMNIPPQQIKTEQFSGY